MDGEGDGPDEEVGGGVGPPGVRICDGVFGVADAHCAGGGPEAQGFFDDGEGVVQLVDDVGVGADDVCCGGGVGAEDLVVFGAEFGEDVGVLGEEVVDVL